MEVKCVELIKKNIHMDRVKCRANSQVALEEDMNIPDSKPDVNTVIYDNGQIRIEEIKPTDDHVSIRGVLVFQILYESKEDGQQMIHLDGKIPFEEQLYMEGATNTDNIKVNCRVEDLATEIINSRKLSVQALIDIRAEVEEIYDEEAPVDLYQDESNNTENGCCTQLEYRKKNIEVAQIAIQKNDIFRVREEIALPQNYPNVFSIVWENTTLEDVEFKPLEEKLSVQGEIHIFILYEAEGEEQAIRAFETSIPFGGTIECHGCREDLITDMSYEIGHKELEVRPDFDGEERMLGLELVLDIGMKMYEEDRIDVLTDIYGVSKEVNTITKNTNLKKLRMKIGGKSKISDRIKIKNGSDRILQLLHNEGRVQVDNVEITDDGLQLQGSAEIQVLYVTGNDSKPYNSVKGTIPFTYSMDVPNIAITDSYRYKAELEQLQVVMLDSEELDVKAVLRFAATVFENIPVSLITDVEVSELEMSKVNDLPSMVAYVVKPEDNLWNIGKKYYLPVNKIKEVNGLTSDELKVGEKLLLVKGM